MVIYVCVLTARRGRGYTPADQNKREDQPIGVIPIDSIYTPVSRVILSSRKYSCWSNV